MDFIRGRHVDMLKRLADHTSRVESFNQQRQQDLQMKQQTSEQQRMEQYKMEQQRAIEEKKLSSEQQYREQEYEMKLLDALK